MAANKLDILKDLRIFLISVLYKTLLNINNINKLNNIN